ncbi:MAG: prepilin-type N-terminal cleavage/methylation domain-containing protein [Thermodesulfobacteriota bacterium]|nr:prepilin-type N-terminal cleavage/methylation domain-containing protein [Thermodesulfobacteriota bacterium]
MDEEMHKFSNDKGFTLIEVMIAIFILVVGLLGVAGVAVTVINGNAFSKEITTATTLAQDKMEELKNTRYSNITSGSDTQDSFYTRTWTSTPDSPAADMKTIDVTVQFPWKGATHNVTLNTIVAK